VIYLQKKTSSRNDIVLGFPRTTKKKKEKERSNTGTDAREGGPVVHKGTDWKKKKKNRKPRGRGPETGPVKAGAEYEWGVLKKNPKHNHQTFNKK